MKGLYCFAFINGLYLGVMSAPLRYAKYWAPLDMPSRIREMLPGLDMPGNKKAAGTPQTVRGLQIPNVEDGWNEGVSAYRPFDDQFATSLNYDSGDSIGFGLGFQPANPLGLNQNMVHETVLQNGGIAPRFMNNPLIGPLDPSIFGFGWGYAQESIDYQFGGDLTFPDYKSGNMFDFLGGISAKKKRVQGGFEAPILDGGYKWPFSGKVKYGTDDVQVNYGHGVNPTNWFDLPIDQKMPYYYMGSPAQTIPVKLNR